MISNYWCSKRASRKEGNKQDYNRSQTRRKKVSFMFVNLTFGSLLWKIGYEGLPSFAEQCNNPE